MIGRIKALLEVREREEAGAPHGAEQKHLAAAALMVEAARLDQCFDAAERAKVAELLESRFGLSESEAGELIEAAEAINDDSSELVRFTRVIKETFSAEERIDVIEMLWEVAYADGVLHHYEANLLRRIAGLIYVSDRDRGAARKRVLERMGLGHALARA